MNTRISAVAAIASSSAIATAASVGSVHAATAACGPPNWGTVVGATFHYCGPATGSLSVFPGVTFRSGSCVSEEPSEWAVEIGINGLVRKKGDYTNRGFPALLVSLIGGVRTRTAFSPPTFVEVTAFHDGKVWFGTGRSYRGDARGGTATFHGMTTLGSHGTATLTFHC